MCWLAGHRRPPVSGPTWPKRLKAGDVSKICARTRPTCSGQFKMTVRSVIDELKEPPAGAPTPRYEMTDQSVNKLTDDLSTFHVRICLPRISPPVPEIRFVRAPAPLDLFIARWLWIKSIATKLWVMHPHGTGCTLQDSCGPDPAGDL